MKCDWCDGKKCEDCTEELESEETVVTITRMGEFLSIIQNATNSELLDYRNELDNEISRSNNAIAEGMEDEK